MSVGRNDPCPCGSGLKYKRCCLAKGDGFAPTIGDQGSITKPGGVLSRVDWRLVAILGAASAGLGLVAGLLRDLNAGLAVFLAAALGSAIYLVVRHPPADAGRSSQGHAGVGFGRSRGGPRRPPTRQERRRDGDDG